MSETNSSIRHILISWIAQNIDMSTSLIYYINCLQRNICYQNQQGEGKFNWENWPLDVNIAQCLLLLVKYMSEVKISIIHF